MINYILIFALAILATGTFSFSSGPMTAAGTTAAEQRDLDTLRVSVKNVDTGSVTTSGGSTNSKADPTGTTTATGLDNTTTKALTNAQNDLRNNNNASRTTPTITPPNNQLSALSVITPQAALPLARAAPTHNIVNTKAFYDIIFRTGSSAAIKTIELVFPSGYSVACCLPFLNEVAGVGPGTASTSGSQTLIYTVSAADPPVIASGTTVRLEYANIQNPTSPSGTLTVSITTKDKNGATIDGPTNSAAYSIKQIGTGDIANNAITGAKILNGTVTSGDIAPGTFSGGVPDNSVTTTKVVDGQIMTADIANNAITTDKIQDGHVGASDIGGASINDAHLYNIMRWYVDDDGPANGGVNWAPDGVNKDFRILNIDFTESSVISISLDSSTPTTCGVYDRDPTQDPFGDLPHFKIHCDNPPPDGAVLLYSISPVRVP